MPFTFGYAGTAGLPPELQRLLKTIQDLDERAQGASVGVHHTLLTCH